MRTDERASLQLFINRLTSRSVLTLREREAILGLPVQTKRVDANRDFVRLGETTNHTCLIVDGLVGRFDQNHEGERQITALHIAGDMPDLQTVTQPNAWCALQALSPTTILKVPRAALRELSLTHSGIAQALWRDCVADSMILAKWLLKLGRGNSQARVAHLICEMACRYGARDQQNELTYRLPMTQAQLADAMGMTPVHMNRTLKALKQSGTTFRSGVVVIEDWQALTGIADFNGEYLQAGIDLR